MKAVVKYGYGKGETELRDVPVPSIKNGDLLIEIKAAGICGSDIAFDEGGHENLLKPPVILGHEFSGVVAQVGKDVTDWRVGDRVVSENTGYVCGKCHACSTANYLACPERLGLGYGMDGGFTKYVRVPGQILVRHPTCLFHIPDKVSLEEAAILDPCCNNYTAIVQESNFLPGEDIAIFGPGPMGLFAVQVARVAGAAKLIIIGNKKTSQVRLEQACQLGATHVVYADEEDVVQRIRDLTHNEGVALVVDCAGLAEKIGQAIEITRNGGQIVKVGYDEKVLSESLDPILDKAISIKGHFGYDYVSWKNCIKLLEAGLINMKSMISHRLPLSEWEKGFDLVRNRQGIKVLLEPEEN